MKGDLASRDHARSPSASLDLAAIRTALLANVRWEIWKEVAYAFDLAASSTPERRAAALSDLAAQDAELIFGSAEAEESAVYPEWRPIETAPRDGTRLLVVAQPNEVPSAAPKVKVAFYQPVAADNFMAPGLWMFEGAEPLSYTPTRWAPLPKANS